MPTIDLAAVLRAAGLTVVEHPGWRTRGRPGPFDPCAVMVHHDASARGPSPAMARYIAEVGRPEDGISAPLAQLWVDTRGVWHVLAAGRANHAGTGSGWGVVPADAGNTLAYGVEVDHTTGEPWPDEQLRSLRIGCRALLDALHADPRDALPGHKDYAPGRKVDPDLDMPALRRAVAAHTPTQEEDMPLTDADLDRIEARVAAAVKANTVPRTMDDPTTGEPARVPVTEVIHRIARATIGVPDAIAKVAQQKGVILPAGFAEDVVAELGKAISEGAR